MTQIRAQLPEVGDGEQHPAQHEAQTGVDVSHEPGRSVQPAQQERLFQNQQRGVVHAPQHEVPACPVP